LGYAALHQMDGGEEHMTAVGYNAGDAADGNTTCTFIGSNTDPNTAGTDNETVIGYNTTGAGGTNTVTLGNASVTDVYMSQDSGATVHCAGVASSDDIVMADGKGIDFSATADAATAGITMTGETLDDYETGTWTAQLDDGAGRSWVMDEAGKTGYYTKIGNLVTVTGYFATTSQGTASGAGIRFEGLPFTIANNNAAYSCGSVGSATGLAITAGCSIGLYTNVGDTAIILTVLSETSGHVLMTADQWSPDGACQLSFTYRAAA